MSNLDKDKVLKEFSAAYKKAEGKEPDIQESNGWYSVNDSKGMRLAKIEEWRQELENPKTKTKPKSKTKAKPKASADKKSATKKSTASKSKNKGSGATAKELWRQRLSEQAGDSRLPRGF